MFTSPAKTFGIAVDYSQVLTDSVDDESCRKLFSSEEKVAEHPEIGKQYILYHFLIILFNANRRERIC